MFEERHNPEVPQPNRQPPSGPRFPLGRLLTTCGALEQLNSEDVQQALRRHVSGDWGELSVEDWKENELSLREGFRLLSAYQDRQGTPFWIITESNRSITTVLLPEEY